MEFGSPTPRPRTAPAAPAAASVEENNADGVNVRVCIRCRPMNEAEKRGKDNAPIVQCQPQRHEINLLTGGAQLDQNGRKSTKTYTFDQIFDPRATQQDVYNEAVLPLVEEVMEGFNCTVFAYGQTGTGKTHTMEGALGDEDTFRPEAGIIPRACNTIFDRLEAAGHEFSVRISLLELYNEQMCDLLAPPVDESKPDIEKKALRLFEDATGKRGVMVSGLEEILCTSARDVFRLLVQASARRRTSSTQMNDKSSRSHCIFTMTIHTKESSPAGEDIIKMGRLNLVDLAGSENIARSGAKNKQATEAGHINQSLLTLGRVITALVEKVNHIPYRDSKLTRLLQESLGGRAKTVIIATVSPHALSYEETLSTLDYAHRAKNIKNRPECNQKLTQRAYVKDLSGQISMLKKENEALRLKNGIYLHQDQWDSMQSEIAAGKTRAADLEATLAAKEQELVSVAEICKYKTKQLEVSEAQKAKVQQELVVTQTELTTTVSNLEQRTAELAVETFVVGKATQNAAAAASQGSTLKSTLVSTVADVKALHAKIDRKAGVLESNRTAATDMSKSVSERLAMLQASSETFQSTSVQATQEAQLALSQFMSSKAAEFEALSAAVGQLVASIAGNANQAMSNVQTFNSDSSAALNTLAATNAEIASVASNQIVDVGQEHIARIVALQTALLAQGAALQTTAAATSAQIQIIVEAQNAFAEQHLNAMSQLTDAVNKASSEQDAAFESRLQLIEQRRAEQKAAATKRAAELAMAVQQLLQAHEQAVESEFVEMSTAELEFVSTTRNSTSQHHEQVLQSIDQSTEAFNQWNSTSSEQHAGLTASIATDSELAVSQLNAMHTSADAIHEDVIKPFVAAGTLAWTDAANSTQTAVDGVVQQCTAANEAAVQSNMESIEISNAFNAQQAEISSRFDSICQSFVATADESYANEINSLQSHTQSLCDELQSCGDVVSRTINQWKADLPTGATPAKDREYPLPSQMIRARTAAELRAMYGVEEETADEVQEAIVAPIVLPIEDAVEVDKENDSLSFASLAPPTPVNVATPPAEVIVAVEKPIVVEKAAVEKAAEKPALVKKTSSIPTKTTGRSLRAPKAALSDTTSSALNSTHAVMKGHVMKRGGGHVSSAWKRRFCVLSANGILSYHLDEATSHDGDGSGLGSIDIRGTACRVVSMASCSGMTEVEGYSQQMLQLGFLIVCTERVFHFIAERGGRPLDWIAAIQSFVPGTNEFSLRCAGMLQKEGGFFSNWKSRYFVCGARHMFYFPDKQSALTFTALAGDDVSRLPESLSRLPLGMIPMADCNVCAAGDAGSFVYQGHANTFKIVAKNGDSRVYYILADNQNAMIEWMGHCKGAAAGDPVADNSGISPATSNAASRASSPTPTSQDSTAPSPLIKVAASSNEPLVVDQSLDKYRHLFIAAAEAAAVADAQARARRRSELGA